MLRGVNSRISAVLCRDRGYPIAGFVFLCLGVVLFVTSQLQPTPLWLSLLVTVVGMGIGIGFAIARPPGRDGLGLFCGIPRRLSSAEGSVISGKVGGARGLDSFWRRSGVGKRGRR